MVFDILKVTGIGEYVEKTEKDATDESKSRTIYYKKAGDKAFLVVNKHTIELRTDRELAKLLENKYESVMESRYFGRGGIEIVPTNQLSPEELGDLIRLSYDLTA